METGGSLAFSGRIEEWSEKQQTDPKLDVLRNEDSTIDNRVQREQRKPTLAVTEDESEEVKRRVGDKALWFYYFKSTGVLNLVIVALLTVTAVTGSSFPQLWLKYTTGSFVPSLGVFVGVFGAVSVTTWVAEATQITQILIRMAPKSAAYLHQILVKTTFNAPISYFESIDTSLVLNRFSQDMSLVELPLPISIWQLFMAATRCIINLGLLTVGSTFMALTVPIIVTVLYWIQNFYLRTSKQVRLLDLEAKSPLYQHFTETLEGLATIRAFGWQGPFEEQAVRKLEESQKPHYLMICIQMWLNLVLGLLNSALAVILMMLALYIPTSSNAGSLGVGLTTTLVFNESLASLISTWTQAETSLGSIARTKSYEETVADENLGDGLDPGSDWPMGKVRVSDVTVVYNGSAPSLKKVNFEIQRGEKFGICGRTGSGKSTLLSVLFRLIDPTSGAIFVDDIDIGSLGRNLVREKLVCLPQDPLLLPGTFQFNLDPEGKMSSTARLETVLKKVQIWDLVAARGGLNTEVQADSLSHGEQQLLCLARAIIKNQSSGERCILVLDEATSNLDGATETIVQKVIREEFGENTVIAVAHRLDTLRDFDRIVVLERGSVAKIGPAREVIADVKLESKS